MLAPTFTVSVLEEDEEPNVVCAGEFDMAVAERFREAVDEALAAQPKRLHFDCDGVTFIDSLGLRALMHTESRCRDNGIAMTIAMSPSMRRLFDAVGATQLFNQA